MRQIKTLIPIAIIRQGGPPVIIGRAELDEDGNIAGRLEHQAIDDVALESLGNVSFALYLPRQLLRRMYRRKGRHQRTP